MSNTRVNVHWWHSHRFLGVDLYFNRDVIDLDNQRCKHAFALALHAAFTQRGVGLETIFLEGLNEGSLYRLVGYAVILQGDISAEQTAYFGEAFLEQLNSITDYEAVYQRQLRRPE